MRELNRAELEWVTGAEKIPVPRPKPKPPQDDCEVPWYERFSGLPPKDVPDLVEPDPFS